MKKVLVLCILLMSFSAHAQDQLIGARFPALSPDGSKISFSYMGDLWVVGAEGGHAARLTNHKAYDGESIWSPDGSTIAFSSDRSGNNDVYTISVNGGTPKRLTWHSGSDKVTDFSPDGKYVYFMSGRSSRTGMYKIKASGGNAEPVIDKYWATPYDTKISPDGQTVMFSLGLENNYTWRKGYRGANSAKIWKRSLKGGDATEVIADLSNSYWPQWCPQGDHIFFVSDRDIGVKNIYNATAEGEEIKAVTNFKEHNITNFKTARTKSLGVYERNFGIWITNLSEGESHVVAISSPNEMKDNSIFSVKNGRVSEFVVSPDGKKIAAVVEGEIFVMSSEGGYARNISNTPARERELNWDSESKNIVYVSDEGANPSIYLVNALGNEKPEKLTSSKEIDRAPIYSPDGELIAYYRGTKELRIMKKDGSDDKVLYEGTLGGRVASGYSWSPDSKYIAVVNGAYADQNIVTISVEEGNAIELTNTAYDEDDPVWSPDGKSLYFTANRFGHSFPEFTGKWDVYRLFLEPKEDDFDEDDFEKLFAEKEDKKDEKSSVDIAVKINLENIDRQTEMVNNTLGNEGYPVINPKDGNVIYTVSNVTGTRLLYTTEYKDGSWRKYTPFMPAVTNPGYVQFDKAGKYIYYTRSGKIGRIDVKAKKNKSISFSTEIEVEKADDYKQILSEIYYVLKNYYYDPDMHNVDWDKLYKSYLPVLEQIREDKDFYDYANDMIGFLNSSHTGIRFRSSGSNTKPSAHFGAVWRFENNRPVVDEILKDSPLYRYRTQISSGAELVAVNGENISSVENMYQLLNGKMDRRLKLTFRSSGENVDITLKPISARAETGLIYDEWVESRRSIVIDKTGNDVAYIHMAAMGGGDLTKFLKELERDAVPRGGLILDLRYNFGGNVHDRVLNALTTPVYAKWQVRGLDMMNQSTYGFADKPVVVLTNEVTLSDGEMTAAGFKSLNRGKIIGNTTYGWLIFTSSWSLPHNAYVRLPFWGCYTLDGVDLETHGGVVPDITVINDLNDDLNGTDPQLDRAIQEILNMIKK